MMHCGISASCLYGVTNGLTKLCTTKFDCCAMENLYRFNHIGRRWCLLVGLVLVLKIVHLYHGLIRVRYIKS